MQTIFVSEKYRSPKRILRTLFRIGNEDAVGEAKEEGEDAA